VPIYVYETVPGAAGDPVERFEVRQRFGEAPLATHPTTGKPVRRVISGGLGIVPTPGTASAPAPGPGCGPETCTCGRFD
jgi:hypothetical protein